MANSIQVVNPITGKYYTITVTAESSVVLADETGQLSYFMRVATTQKDAEGNTIPDQILTIAGTDKFTVAVNAAIQIIMDKVAGFGIYSFSSSSSSHSSS